MKHETRKLLINDVSLNPFNDKFDPDKAKNLINLEDDKEELAAIIVSLFLFNKFHKDFYKELLELLHNIDDKIDNLILLLFAVFNRNYIVNGHNLRKERQISGQFDFLSFYSRTNKSIDASLGDVNIISALETDADSLAIVCNLIRHMVDKPLPTVSHSDPIIPIEILKSVYLSSTIYHINKGIYEDGVWNNGKFSCDLLSNKILVRFPDSERLIMYKIGHFRAQTNAIEHIMFLRNQIEKRSKFGSGFIEILAATKADKKIRKVKIVNSEIVVEIAKKARISDWKSEIDILGTIISYYPFLDLGVKDSNSCFLSVSDFVVLITSIHELLVRVEENEFDTSLQKIDDVKRYPVRISEITLKTYLKQITVFSSRQIDFFLEKLTSSFDQRIDLWTSPLVLYKNSYYFSFVTLSNKLIFNIIDIWLDRTGYKLGERGGFFEQHVRNTLTRVLSDSGFIFSIEERNRFKMAGKEEEIDLIFSLRDVAFICEIKCIKYSTNPREDHNAYKILSKAAKQVNRKYDFIKANFGLDAKLAEMLGGRKISKLIITNYPLYSGLKIDNVSVIDFLTLDNYLGSGSLSSGYYTKINGVTTNVKTATNKYYYDETTMNENILDFIESPTPIEKLKSRFKIAVSKYTPQFFRFSVFCEYCSDS